METEATVEKLTQLLNNCITNPNATIKYDDPPYPLGRLLPVRAESMKHNWRPLLPHLQQKQHQPHPHPQWTYPHNINGVQAYIAQCYGGQSCRNICEGKRRSECEKHTTQYGIPVTKNSIAYRKFDNVWYRFCKNETIKIKGNRYVILLVEGPRSPKSASLMMMANVVAVCHRCDRDDRLCLDCDNRC
jgi:hypothetical protein